MLQVIPHCRIFSRPDQTRISVSFHQLTFRQVITPTRPGAVHPRPENAHSRISGNKSPAVTKTEFHFQNLSPFLHHLPKFISSRTLPISFNDGITITMRGIKQKPKLVFRKNKKPVSLPGFRSDKSVRKPHPP